MKGFLIGFVILAFIGFAWYMDKQKTRRETLIMMDSLYEAKKRIINYDSIETKNDRLRKDNEDRFKRYDSINLRRPDF